MTEKLAYNLYLRVKKKQIHFIDFTQTKKIC